MGPGARLDICMFPSVFSKDGVEAIAADIVKLNPQVKLALGGLQLFDSFCPPTDYAEADAMAHGSLAGAQMYR